MYPSYQRMLFGAVAALSLVAPASLSAQDGSVPLALYRTRTAGGTTTVDAVAEIDPRSVAGASGTCDYAVRIAIFGVNNAIVAEDDWSRRSACPAMADSSTRIVETFSFGIRRDRHTVELTVRSADGTERRTRAIVEPLLNTASTSDLILATEIAWDTLAANTWAVRRGSLGIRTEAVVDVPGNRPLLSYYLELYPNAAGGTRRGTVSGSIRRPADERRLVGFTLQEFEDLTESRPVAGTVSLAGLPAGNYEFVATVAFDSARTVELVRPFRVFTAPAASAARPEQRATTAVHRYFETLAEDQLARFDAVVLWMDADDARRTFSELGPEGRRAFLPEFFNRVLPPGSNYVGPGSDALRLYLNRVSEAERALGPARAGGPALWRTDRGRLWIRYGAPTDRITRPFPGNDTRPYEIWYYALGAGMVHLFVDESGFNNYRLLYSTDPNEVTLPGWQIRAGQGAVMELNTLYGIQHRPTQ